jgi:predicted SnoaL-like aldol condensation-catalyzing enzyme
VEAGEVAAAQAAPEVEHWDVAQDIPEKMPHNNGMF